MKKVILIIAVALGMTVAAAAQPKAVGGRFGVMGLEASYEHYLGSPNFLEAELGLNYFNASKLGFTATAIYNWTFAQPSWTPRGTWAWYAGPGVSLGTTYHVKNNGEDGTYFFAGVTGQVGLEYTFWFPLQLSADIRPIISIVDGEFFNEGLAFGFVPCLSVRYAF